MAVDTRRELIDAGIELVVGQRWQDVQASVATKAIADRAGVTTGSFFHHFRSRAHFAQAVADRFVEQWDANVRRLVQDVDELTVGGGGAGVRATAEADWDALDGDRVLVVLQHLLFATSDEPLAEGDPVTAGTVLGEAYRSLTDAVVPAYERAQRAMGREMLPPFSMADLAVALTALADGLQMRGSVDPDAVRDGLYADLISAVVVAVTRPVTERSERTELAALEASLGGPVQLPPAEGTGAGETWRHIADAAAPLFAGRRVADVKVAEIAAAAGVSTSTVYHQFGTVSAVAAAGWVRHLPELQAISSRPLTASEGPVTRIEQVLTRFVELARENRGMIEGLVMEALSVAGPSTDRRRRWDVAREHPLQALVTPHLRELRARGRLRRRIETETLAATIVQVAATRVLLAPDDPVERIVDDSVELLLEGALAPPAG